MSDKYILEDKKPVLEPDLLAWGRWFETADRHVAKTDVGEVHVSTVFLALDHNWGDGPPLLFETLVFGGALAERMNRYSTWDEAEAGHAAMVKRVKQRAMGAAA
ncbi:MAG: hypothetical protein V3S55_06230 [Nitrospiraceae bacterium]